MVESFDTCLKCMLSCFSSVRLYATLWTVACQAPLSMGFSRQEYWNGLPFPSPGHLPDLEIEPMSLPSPALAGGFFTIEPPGCVREYPCSMGLYTDILKDKAS